VRHSDQGTPISTQNSVEIHRITVRQRHYLSNKARMTPIGDVILTYVTMEPVAEVQVAIIQRQDYVSDQSCELSTNASKIPQIYNQINCNIISQRFDLMTHFKVG